MSSENEVKFLTVEEVARELRVSMPTVRTLIAEGKLKATRVGRQQRIARKDLDEYIKNN